jgi:tetratricopeptide (TPR) repeat protein
MNKKAKIVVNSMVGNESKTILRMLESVAPYVDYYVIQCNGSDDTEQKINDFFGSKNIPGFTYQIEWNFPGWNRDHTLQKCLAADHGCDWILRMDADERLHVDDSFDWSILDDTSVQSYNITAQAHATRYFRTWFWNARLPWFFQHDKRHETIHLPEIGEDFQRLTMPYGFRHLVSQDGDTWAAPRKFLRDALELEIDKVVGNKVHEDYYHLWYLAKSYADCYGKVDELPFGRKHSEEYARRSNWYYDRFMELTHVWGKEKKPKYKDEMAYFGLIVMGWNYDFLNESDTAEQYFKLAGEFSDDRNENLIYLAFHYELRGRIKDALETIESMIKVGRKNPFPEKSFLIEDRAYVDTSNFLLEYRDFLIKKSEEHIIDSESFKFDFN